MNRMLFSVLVVITLFMSGCGPQQQMQPQADPTPSPVQPVQSAGLRGRVVDMAGNPIQGAAVSAASGSALSDEDGWFEVPSKGAPQWVTVKQAGFISRTRAAAPGIPVLFRLSPDDGKTVVINFGGDTMFGRRFFDPNEDGDPSDGFLPIHPGIQDHIDLSMPVQPLLENADLTVLNFESPLTDQPFFSMQDTRPTAYHSTKDYVFASHLNAAAALRQSGVDVVDLGNNHMYDLLEEGLGNTISALDEAGLVHFGAGPSESTAWAPAIIPVKGQTIVFVGCTTIWRPDPPVSPNDVTYVAADGLQKGGAARCNDARLAAAINEGKRQGNMVVAMIHGGYEYSRSASKNTARLTEIARSAGAALVINHHSHVVGGFSLANESLIAWSMGNFIFDQVLWPTFESYMLSVYIQEGKVIRAYIEPLIIEDYVAHGLTGSLANYVARDAAGLEPGPFVLENGAMEIDLGQKTVLRSRNLAMDGDIRTGEVIPIPDGQWISSFAGAGNLVLGRDLLWIGGFEDLDVDHHGEKPPLWDFGPGGVQAGKAYAYEGEGGIRLTRGSGSIEDAVTGPLHRLLIKPYTRLSITGMIRASGRADPQIQVSWYGDLKGPSFTRVVEPIAVQPGNDWQPFRVDVEVPSNAVGAGIFLRLPAPGSGVARADFDNLRVIQWAEPGLNYSPLYDFALLKGSGEITFSQQVLPGGEAWFTLP